MNLTVNYTIAAKKFLPHSNICMGTFEEVYLPWSPETVAL